MIRPLPRYSACLNPQGKLSQLDALKAMLKNTDPFELSRHIDQQLEGLYKLAAQRNAAAREKAPLRELRPNVDATSTSLTRLRRHLARLGKTGPSAKN